MGRGRERAGDGQDRPYQDVAAKLAPDRASGRLKARYKLTVRNRANAPTEVVLSAEDTDGELSSGSPSRR